MKRFPTHRGGIGRRWALAIAVAILCQAHGAWAGPIVFYTDTFGGHIEGEIGGSLAAGTGSIKYLGKTNGVAQWRVDGDLNFTIGDTVTSSGGPVSIIVGNNVHAEGVTFDFTRLGGAGGSAGAAAGFTNGGNGGGGGQGGEGGEPGTGGVGGGGGGTPPGPGGAGSDGHHGSNGPSGDDGDSGSSGGSGFNSGLGGAGGTGGQGGSGGQNGGDAQGAPPSGNDGQDGPDGGNGQPGSPGAAGMGGVNIGALFGLLSEGSGGGGGGGGGAGGGGAGGSGGGGGSGGKGQVADDIQTGKPGGQGGAGGGGGEGGFGGGGNSGGAGGDGGGAFEIIANGRLLFGDGTVAGSSGQLAGPYSGNSGGGFFGDPGQPGQSGPNVGLPGGNGGEGGQGGAGALGAGGGNGGGGAGGTIHLIGTTASAQKIDTSGGEGGGAPSSDGAIGGFKFGENTPASVAGDNPTLIVGAAPDYTIGTRDGNPFEAGNPQTPFIPDLPDVGAEIYGRSELMPDDIAKMLPGMVFPDKDVNNTPLDGSAAALVRLPWTPDEGSGHDFSLLGRYAKGYYDNFVGFDMLVYVNLAGVSLADPGMTLGNIVLMDLLERGWKLNPDFDGPGPMLLGSLDAGGVYITLAPRDSFDRAALLGAEGSISLPGFLGEYDVLYLQAKIVPEPSSYILALTGAGIVAVVVRRRRNHNRGARRG